jgi:DNA-directed RNA polymerase subunit RPC12/RpoP
MIKNIITTQELDCPCCGEKITIKVTESGNVIVTPFVSFKPDKSISEFGYEFGVMKGGEKNE